MKPTKLSYRVVLIVSALAQAISGLSCTPEEVLLDANGDPPTSRLGVALQKSVLSRYAYTEVFYNTPDVDADEGVSDAEAEFAANCVECAWLLYISPPEGTVSADGVEYAFHNPLGSPHVEVPENELNLPLWVRASCGCFDPFRRNDTRIACGGGPEEICTNGIHFNGLGPGNGGGGRPNIKITPLGSLFGCSGCNTDGLPPNGYDPVALHEFGHVLFKSYNAFLNSGPVSFLNEGLPSGLVQVPLSIYYDPDSGDTRVHDNKDLKQYLNLRDRSLRNLSYGGSPFWYFLAMKYTRITDSAGTPVSDGTYEDTLPGAHIPEVCRQYAQAIDPAMSIRRMPGRDVILHIQEAFAECHPLGLDTPEVGALSASCAGEDGPGYVPAGDPGFPNWDDRWGDEWAHKVGEVLMPLVLEQIDYALDSTRGLHDMVRDELPYQAFREFLVENYLNGARLDAFAIPTETVTTDTGPVDVPLQPDFPYRLKSFGAHYHKLNLSGSGGCIVRLEKGPGMPDWAYHVFYVDFDTPVPLFFPDATDPDPTSPWRNLDTDELFIPPDYPEAVLVVTAFEGTYDGVTPYADSGGYYDLVKEVPSISVTSPSAGATWLIDHPYLIQWDSHEAGSFVTIRYTTDGGLNWLLVNPLGPSTDNDGQYEWTPGLSHLADHVQIRVISNRYPTVSGISESFSIEGQSISVTQPSHGDLWIIGDPAQIRWTHHNVGSQFDIDLLCDGVTFPVIRRFTPLDTAPEVFYDWPAVAGRVSDDCRIRVTSVDYPGHTDTSRRFFVQERGLTLTFPNTAVTYYVGNDYSIQWEGYGIGDTVMLELSRDAGRTWTTVEPATANDGQTVWRATGPLSTQCRFRVTAVSDPAYSDMSDTDFTIDQRTTTVVTPNGGEHLVIGAPYTITWADNFFQDDRVLVVLERDGTEETIGEIRDEGRSEYSWTVAGPAASKCRVIIIHTGYDIKDSSDAFFSIGSSP